MRLATRFSVAASFCLLVVSAHSQFYAPDTEFHDPVQRVFPVEAARVLAWRANQQTNRIAEVSFTVSTATNGTTTWQLVCLDTNSKPLRTAKLEYPSNLLSQGQGFYREVMRQLLSSEQTEIKPLPAAQAIDAFWSGAELAGLSREESLARALAISLVASNRTDDAWVPQRLYWQNPDSQMEGCYALRQGGRL